ncbi:EamA family transporter [Glaciecola sp. 1036]|uniref:EamA family transporter n=1 Tax=Alteromonadaceae TaxID=72275 RepID=UPI003D0782A7
MNIFTLALVFCSVFLSVVAQILLKHGMTRVNLYKSSSETLFNMMIQIFTNISVLAGLFAYVASAGVWLVVLSKLDVSKAYPFVGLGFILTMLFAYWFLGESMTTYKVIGTLLIVSGIVFISHSK